MDIIFFHTIKQNFCRLTVFWLLMLGVNVVAFGATPIKIESIRIWPAPENSRIVFDLSAKPEFSYFTLKSPDRLVIDFKQSENHVPLAELAETDPRVKKIRTSRTRAKGTTRIVLDLAQNFDHSVFPLAPAGQYGDRLVVDLYDRSQPKPVVAATSNNNRDVIIAIDAGHGGEDPGSIGARGTYEKRVTLAIAKKLQQLINQTKGMHAVMTRSGDYYVDLDKRTEIARRKHADFLVSIHADAFSSPRPHGSSVWVVSGKRVENELARWLVNREKNSELLGGGGGVIKHTHDDNLAYMLADMNKDHSLEVSIATAQNVVQQLKHVTKLHKRTPQHASFAVLKASDIPSILVETGFISNYKEEQRLKNNRHQQQLADAIFKGVKHYFNANPPKDSYFAAIGFKQHKVSSGESLSVLAQRYKVSVRDIKTLNHLSSANVMIGQTLKIPKAD